jgi:hypothetical protein
LRRLYADYGFSDFPQLDSVTASATVKKRSGFSEEMSADGFVSLSRRMQALESHLLMMLRQNAATKSLRRNRLLLDLAIAPKFRKNNYAAMFW